MELEGLLRCPQGPTSGSYPEPDGSSPHTISLNLMQQLLTKKKKQFVMKCYTRPQNYIWLTTGTSDELLRTQ